MNDLQSLPSHIMGIIDFFKYHIAQKIVASSVLKDEINELNSRYAFRNSVIHLPLLHLGIFLPWNKKNNTY